MRTCSIDKCNNKYRAKGYCRMHYQRFLRHGNPHKKLILHNDYKYCTYKDCTKKHLSKGYCIKHYRSILKPHKVREFARTRRAKKRNNGFEKYTEFEVLQRYGTYCYLCNTPIDLKASRKSGSVGWQKGLHIEHVIDIAKGGPDTIANVRPAHALCNLTKKPIEMV